MTHLVIETAGGVVTGVSLDGEYTDNYTLIDYDDVASDPVVTGEHIRHYIDQNLPAGDARTTILNALSMILS